MALTTNTCSSSPIVKGSAVDASTSRPASAAALDVVHGVDALESADLGTATDSAGGTTGVTDHGAAGLGETDGGSNLAGGVCGVVGLTGGASLASQAVAGVLASRADTASADTKEDGLGSSGTAGDANSLTFGVGGGAREAGGAGVGGTGEEGGGADSAWGAGRRASGGE